MWQSAANEIYFRLSIVNLFPVSNWTIFSDEEKRMRAHNRDKRLTGFHHFTWELVGCCDYTICQNYRAWIINCVWTVFPTAWLLILDEYFIVFEFYRTDGAPNDIFLSIFHSFAIGCMQRLWYNATISMNTPKTESVLFKRLNLFLDMKGYERLRKVTEGFETIFIKSAWPLFTHPLVQLILKTWFLPVRLKILPWRQSLKTQKNINSQDNIHFFVNAKIP